MASRQARFISIILPLEVIIVLEILEQSGSNRGADGLTTATPKPME